MQHLKVFPHWKSRLVHKIVVVEEKFLDFARVTTTHIWTMSRVDDNKGLWTCIVSDNTVQQKH